MENICRCCLRVPQTQLLSLYDRSDIIYKIETIASIQIIKDTNFPSNICEECYNNVNKLFNFRKVLLHSHKELHERQITLQQLQRTTDSQDQDDNESIVENFIKIESDNHDDIDTDNDTNELDFQSHTHQLENVLKKVKQLKCPHCNQTFTSRIKLSNHRRTEHVPRAICNICGMSVRQDNLGKHVRMHTEKPVKCPECDRTCKNTESLRCHMLLHRDTIFTCEICGKQLKIKSEYKRHIKAHYNPEFRKTTCKICGKVVKDLKKHMYSHTGERPHICLHCNRGFTSSHALKVHTRQHTNEKPYKCEFCPMAFPQKISLTTHLRLKHDGLS